MRACHIWLHITLESLWPHYMILEVCWDGLWTLSFGLSQFHGHGSWLVCEVALSNTPSVPKWLSLFTDFSISKWLSYNLNHFVPKWLSHIFEIHWMICFSAPTPGQILEAQSQILSRIKLIIKKAFNTKTSRGCSRVVVVFYFECQTYDYLDNGERAYISPNQLLLWYVSVIFLTINVICLFLYY